MQLFTVAKRNNMLNITDESRRSYVNSWHVTAMLLVSCLTVGSGSRLSTDRSKLFDIYLFCIMTLYITGTST